MKRLQDKSVVIGVPTLAALILGLIGGVAQVINYSVIDAGTQLHAIIAVALYFLISVGIPPLTGSAFRAALHLPAWASYIVGGLLGCAVLALSTITMSATLHEVLAAVITVGSALGFSASVEPVPPVAPTKT